MYDPETDAAFVKTLKQCLAKRIKVVEAELSFNQPEFSRLVADEVGEVM